MRSGLRSAPTPAEQERAANHLENHLEWARGLGRRVLEKGSGLKGAPIRGIEGPCLVHPSAAASATIIAASAVRPRSLALPQRFLLELGSGEIETERLKRAGQMLIFKQYRKRQGAWWTLRQASGPKPQTKSRSFSSPS
jgi:hypothetical protein